MMAILAGAGVLVLWVFVPLVPAILIYRLFPGNPLVVSGPLAGLTVKTGGAFGAYLLIFVLTWGQIDHLNNLVGGIHSQLWTVKTNVRLVDERGTPITSDEWIKNLAVVVKPDFLTIDKYQVRLRLVEDKEGMPLTVFDVDKFGRHTVDWATVNRDPRSGTIDLGPITIKRVASTSAPLTALPARLDLPSDSSDSAGR
jgi:hypothetical protein